MDYESQAGYAWSCLKRVLETSPLAGDGCGRKRGRGPVMRQETAYSVLWAKIDPVSPIGVYM